MRPPLTGRGAGPQDGPICPREEPNMAELTIEELKAELARVRKERDDYRATVADLLKRHYDIDIDEFEAELRHVQQHGGVPWSEVAAMLQSEFGIKL